MAIKNYKLKISSSKDELFKLQRFIEEIGDDYNINNNYFGNILITLNEAVENAIEHGNKNDINKKIIIEFSSKDEGLSFIIKDEGEGFNFNEIPDPTIEENDEQKGRGIFLMKNLSDEILYHPEKTAIELIFKISSINKELTNYRAQLLNNYKSETINKENKAH